MKRGRTPEALEQFKVALRRPPLSWKIDGVEGALTNAYLELGRLDEAVSEYQRLISLRPHHPLAHYRLGQAYERKGEAERARAAFGRFLQLWSEADQDISEVVEARRKLAGQ